MDFKLGMDCILNKKCEYPVVLVIKNCTQQIVNPDHFFLSTMKNEKLRKITKMT